MRSRTAFVLLDSELAKQGEIAQLRVHDQQQIISELRDQLEDHDLQAIVDPSFTAD